MYQVEKGFILPIEKEIFIDQLKDIVDKAEDILSEDMDGEKTPELETSHLPGQTPRDQVGEVMQEVTYISLLVIICIVVYVTNKNLEI